MKPRTSESYKRDILEKYKREKGGEMIGYLSNPTRKQIREACLWLLDKRELKYDEQTLNRFFQFDFKKSKSLQIQQFKPDKFVPIVKFLKGKTKDTSIENLELIAWLIDFKPRPLTEYLNSNHSVNLKEKLQDDIVPSSSSEEPTKAPSTSSSLQSEPDIKKKKKRKLIITISIAFSAFLILTTTFTDWIYPPSPKSKCMTWADSLYVPISCEVGPRSKFGTKIEPVDPIKLKNFKKVEVDMTTQFFAEDDKPMIWYYKNKDGEIEYFTAPGLHPITGETLRKITPYIIETYVPVHMNKPDSFLRVD